MLSTFSTRRCELFCYNLLDNYITHPKELRGSCLLADYSVLKANRGEIRAIFQKHCDRSANPFHITLIPLMARYPFTMANAKSSSKHEVVLSCSQRDYLPGRPGTSSSLGSPQGPTIYEPPEFEPRDLHYICPLLTEKRLARRFAGQNGAVPTVSQSLARFLNHSPWEIPFSEHIFDIAGRNVSGLSLWHRSTEIVHNSLLAGLNNQEYGTPT
jgi:hypothetical protein